MNDPPSMDSSSFDIESLNSYICGVSFLLLSAEKDFFYKLLHEERNQIIIRAFATDTQSKLLVVSKIIPEEKSQSVYYEFRLEIASSDFKNPTIGFLKRINILSTKKGLEMPGEAIEISTTTGSGNVSLNEESYSLSHQLQVINIGYHGHDSSPFVLAHNYVQNSLVPTFNTYKTFILKKPQSDQDAYNILMRRITELNLALLHCQQSIEVPEIQLMFDPAIKAKCAQAKTEGRKPSTNDCTDLMNDNNFINSLAQCVSKWIQDISTITKMKYEITTGNTLQEINYWVSFERSLNLIEQQVKMPEVELTLEILKFKRKFGITTTFENDLNLKNIIAKSTKVSAVMKDFPINELLSANTMQDISAAIGVIFISVKKINNNDAYEPSRFLSFLEALSRDLLVQILKILSVLRLMSMPYNEFITLLDQSKDIFTKWDEEFGLIRDLMKKNSKGMNAEITACNFEHLNLKRRLEKVLEIRQHHEKLREVIEGILQKEGSGKEAMSFLTTKDISEAYLLFQNLDILDLSKEGEIGLNAAYKNYEMKIDRVETQITVKLRDRLGAAANANEMFRIFSKFNALFFRPLIRGAIQEYQSQLLRTVQNDIQALRDKFLRQYENTEDFRLCKSRDIPPTSGAVIWARQINRKLKKYMERVENVLGPEWSDHPEGRSLKETGEMFEKHLNTQPMTDNWNKTMQDFMKNNNWNQKIFDVVQKKKLEIVVNFDERMISLFKEIRNFQWMKIRVLYFFSISSLISFNRLIFQ